MTDLAGILEQKVVGSLVEHVVTVGFAASGFSVNNVINADGDFITKIASVDLGGQRVVVNDGAYNVTYADASNLLEMHNVLGLTQGAAALGAEVVVLKSGEITEGSWSWTPDNYVYLGLNGLLTQTVPTSGFLLVIGTAIAPTVLNVNIGAPILLT